MERVNPADVARQQASTPPKRSMKSLLDAVSIKEIRDGVAMQNVRSSVEQMRKSIRSLVDEARPQTPDERRRLLMTTTLTEQATRRPSPFNGPKHVYAGTVPWKTKAARRAANRRARVARRANR